MAEDSEWGKDNEDETRELAEGKAGRAPQDIGKTWLLLWMSWKPLEIFKHKNLAVHLKYHSVENRLREHGLR